jgi:hypothetical protein
MGPNVDIGSAHDRLGSVRLTTGASGAIDGLRWQNAGGGVWVLWHE